MAGSHLEQYSVADFLEFRRGNRLLLNPDFQRRSVWTSAAKVYLIDTILRHMPMPKIYLRTTIDPTTQTSVRDVVDGQQRLRAIFEFADSKLLLTARAKEFSGLRYTDLSEELQNEFLAYTIAVEQLINANDDDVLETFARLNSYTVSLNKAELRHAKYQGNFKWAVHDTARDWKTLWDDFRLVTVRQRTRMADDELMAQMFLVITQGITGGEARVLDRAYAHYEHTEFPQEEVVVNSVNTTLDLIETHLLDAIVGPLARGPHFLMVFAAAAHMLHGIGQEPIGGLPIMENYPARPDLPTEITEWELIRDRLLLLGSVIEMDEVPAKPDPARFWAASKRTTQNIASRRTRFHVFVEAFPG